MRIAIGALVALTLSAGAAGAAGAPGSGESTMLSETAHAPKLLYICEATPAAKRAFARQFGAVEYVKAADVKAKGDAWTTPKCITPSQARRLKLASAR